MDKTIQFTNEEIKMLKDACLVVISLMNGTKEEKRLPFVINKSNKNGKLWKNIISIETIDYQVITFEKRKKFPNFSTI